MIHPDQAFAVMESPTVLAVWVALVAVSEAVLIHDLTRRNPQIVGLMKWVWILTVLYSGPIGLAIYYATGRRQISRDSIWRRAWRSVAHCYSGCGGGEVAGVFIFAGLLGLGNLWIATGSFTLAYVAGYGLTVGPLVQQGFSWRRAMKDAFVAETASITVMEVTAIGLDIFLARGATMDNPLFWTSLVLSLSAGLFAAYPVNVLLIKMGVKEGMHDPRHHHHSEPDLLRLDEMKEDPTKHFENPGDVVVDPNLSDADKREILKAWEHDARELSVADEENMRGGEDSRLGEISEALRQLGGAPVKPAAPSKLGD